MVVNALTAVVSINGVLVNGKKLEIQTSYSMASRIISAT